MKKINIIMCFALILVFLFGCNKNSVNNLNTVKNDNISVVTTVYPVYDWIRNIGGDKVNVSYLLDNGVDLHNYQPTSEDIIKITTADIFIYIGGESDKWVEDLFDSGNFDTKVINLMENMNDYILV